MQFNSSLNKQESILALTQATKGARALAVRDSNVFKWCLHASKGLGRKRKKVVENNYLLSLLWILIWTRPQTTSQVQV